MANTKEAKVTDLVQDDKNFNRGTVEGQKLMNESIARFGAGRSILIDKNNRIIAGNKTAETYMGLGHEKVRIIETTGDELIAVKRTDIDLDSKKGREMALADNATGKANLDWDHDALSDCFEDDDLKNWGVDNTSWEDDAPQETEEEEIERKKREFEEKMAAGALDEDDPEYQEFLQKFEAKRTTDDCYTPELVYDAVADWVANYYKVSRKNFKRPFYPGGDYQNEKYEKTDIIVDNPPFSIMSEIVRFFHERGMKFFLFGPHLTLINQATDQCCTLLPVGVTVTYANGASVNTSFLTNMEPRNIKLRTEPSLYKAVDEANDKVLAESRRVIPKYSYDKHIVMTPLFHVLSRYGIDFTVTAEESELISQCDSQKAAGKALFGKGYLVSDRLKQEREKAEREKAEREKAEREKAERELIDVWELSDRERKIIERLNSQQHG